jgi:leader peptidase (prepilin peptidase) / N-methyltransferase
MSRPRQSTPQAAVSSSPASGRLVAGVQGASAFRRKRSILATGAVVLLGLAGVIASLAAATDLRGLLGAVLALLMLAIAVVDARRLIIPNQLTAATLALAFVHAAIQEPREIVAAVSGAMLRGAVLALLFLALREVYLRLRGREGLGLGDVKLAGAGGAWLGWSMMPIAIEMAALGALAYYGVRHVASVEAMHARSRIPFGLFLAPAIWLGWLLEALLDLA